MAKAATIEGVPVSAAPAPVAEVGPIKGVPGRKRPADAIKRKVSPRRSFTFVIDLADVEYGPFEEVAVDEAEALSKVYKRYPQLVAHLTSIRPRFLDGSS